MSWTRVSDEPPPFGVRVVAKTVTGLTLLMVRCKVIKGGWCWHGNGRSYDSQFVVKWFEVPKDEDDVTGQPTTTKE